MWRKILNGKPKCLSKGIRLAKLFAIAGLFVSTLAGCALYTAASTGKPLDPVQVQNDMIAAGCITAEAAAVAAPIISATTDASGQKVFQAVDAGGAVLCRLPAK